MPTVIEINTSANPAYVTIPDSSSTTVKLNNILPGDPAVDVTLQSGGFFGLTANGNTGIGILAANGYVGVGMVAPTQQLDVNGATRISSNLLFKSINAQHGINPESASAAAGDDVLFAAGATTAAALSGGVMTVRSGKGGDGTGIAVAGPGGDLIIRGADAGSNGGAGGNHGGNVSVIGGLGTNATSQHGGVLIGETTTDEIRIGHEPVSGMDLGHIRLTGHIADTSTTTADAYSVRFDNNPVSGTHIVDVNAPGVGSLAAYLSITSGRGGAADGATAGGGGIITLQGGPGGAGSAGKAAGAGGATRLYGGAAGTNGGGGGANGGSVSVDGGTATGAGTTGTAFFGTDNTRTSATSLGHTGATSTIAGGSILFSVPTAGTALTITNSGSNSLLTAPTTTYWDSSLFQFSYAASRTITGQNATAAGSGGMNIYIQGGQAGGNGGLSGGDINIVGGARNGSTYGGSIRADGSAGNSLANSGVVLIATLGNTFRVQICETTSLLSFFVSTGVAQQTPPGITTAGFTANASTDAVFAQSTFTGNTGANAYTISDVVRCLKNYGLLTA